MSYLPKNTLQKILLFALSGMTICMIFVSVFNYKDNKQKIEYLETERILAQEELQEIIKNYDLLIKQYIVAPTVLKEEKGKVKVLLEQIGQNVLDYEEIINYRKQLLILRKNNKKIQHSLGGSIQSRKSNTSYY